MTTSIISVSETESKIQVNGADALTFNSSGDVGVRSINGGQLAGLRNRIINGGMQVDQRNSGAAQTIVANVTAAYCLDRWQAYSGGSNSTAQRVAGASSQQYAIRLTGSVSNTGTELTQKIEAVNCHDLANKTVTVSLRASSSSITTLTWIVDFPAGGVDTWTGATQIATGTLALTATDAALAFTFNAGANAVNGLRVRFQTGPLTAANTISFQAVQLELGSVATPLEHRPYGMELALCQRYYEKSYHVSVVPGTGSNVSGYVAYGWTAINRPLNTTAFAVEKRISPTVVIYNSNSGAVGTMRNADQATDVAGSVVNAGGKNFIAFNSGSGFMGNAIQYHWTASAEL